MIKKWAQFSIRIPSFVAVGLIWVYQKTLSPDHGLFKAMHPHGFCRFYPSCSQYTKEAILRHGLIKGAIVGGQRVAKCNPWTEPKVDPIELNI